MAFFRTGGGGGIPAALKSAMNAVLNKKFGTAQTYEPNKWPEDVNLLGALEEKTASGAIAHIEDGADGVPLKNWLVTLPASLDGYTSIVGSQAGKNLIKIASDNYADGQKSTVEYTNSGVSVTATGTYGRSGYSFAVKTGQTYTLSFTGYSTGDYNMVYLNNKVSWSGQFKNLLLTSEEAQYSVTFTSTADLLFIGLYVSGGGTTGTMTISNVQLEVNSSASSYEAYTAPTTYTASLGRTIYGGTADIVTGEGEDENGNAFTFTPITPTPETALGVNNFWADEGDSSVTYRSSGTVTPVPVVPTLISKTITENGTYSAEDDDADGYSEVTVNVQGGETPFVPQFTETLIADNSAHASSFTLAEDYGNYDMVKIVWYESATVSGFLYTTPDILDEIFSIGVGKLCINKPSTNYYICYSKSGLTWTQTNQRNIYVHEIYGVTFTNCTMTATDLYKRGASTTTKYAITSQTSLKDYDLFMMSSIHATDGSETMPTTWLYQYPPENMSDAFSCPVPTVLQEYNGNDEAFVISEYEMSAARFFMVQGIKFTPVSSSRGLMMASPQVTQLVGEESDLNQVNELVEDDENVIPEQLNEVVENDETEQEGEDDA